MRDSVATESIQRMRRLTQHSQVSVLEIKCQCAMVCKNSKGLTIYQPRTKYGRGEHKLQRTVETLSKTLEDSSQEASHRTGDVSAAFPPQSRRRDSPSASGTQPVRPKVKWPTENDRKVEPTRPGPRQGSRGHIGRSGSEDNQHHDNDCLQCGQRMIWHRGDNKQQNI